MRLTEAIQLWRNYLEAIQRIETLRVLSGGHLSVYATAEYRRIDAHEALYRFYEDALDGWGGGFDRDHLKNICDNLDRLKKELSEEMKNDLPMHEKIARYFNGTEGNKWLRKDFNFKYA